MDFRDSVQEAPRHTMTTWLTPYKSPRQPDPSNGRSIACLLREQPPIMMISKPGQSPRIVLDTLPGALLCPIDHSQVHIVCCSTFYCILPLAAVFNTADLYRLSCFNSLSILQPCYCCYAGQFKEALFSLHHSPSDFSRVKLERFCAIDGRMRPNGHHRFRIS